MMNEKIEQIKELEKELFVEEHGITKEQAVKLNEYLFNQSTGKEFDFWAGRELSNPSVNKLIKRLENKIEEQNTRLSELEWEHKKLWMGSTLFSMVIVAITICVYFAR